MLKTMVAGLALAAGLALPTLAQDTGPAADPNVPASKSALDDGVAIRPEANVYRILDWVRPGTEVPKPECPAGQSPRAYATPLAFGMTQGPGPLQGFRTWAEDAGDSWVVRKEMVADSGNAPTSADGGWVKVGVICAEGGDSRTAQASPSGSGG